MMSGQDEFPRNVECETAKEFVEAISPLNPCFGASTFGANLDARQSVMAIFRGQHDAEWGLVPSAFRGGASFPQRGGAFRRPAGLTCRGQVMLEAGAIRCFFSLADRHGLPLPEDSQRLRSLLECPRAMVRTDEQVNEWPPDDLLSLIALAQHYHIPTRLLDWSHDPYVAAYFAVRRSAKDSPSDTANEGHRVAVWALRTFPIRLARALQVGRDPGESDPYGSVLQMVSRLHLVTAPGAGNANLLAQKGIFTLCRDDQHEADEPFYPRTLESVLSVLGQHPLLQGPGPDTALFRFTLPASESRRALFLLAKLGVTAATLFPGYAGVVEALREEDLWDEPSD